MPDPLWGVSAEEENAVLTQASAQRAQRQQASATVTPEMVARAEQIVGQWPNASAGTVQESVRHGLDDTQVAAVAGRDNAAWETPVGALVGFLSDGAEKIHEYAIKPVIRGAFTFAEGLAQEVVQRPLTAASAVAFGDAESYSQAYDEYGDSALRNLAQGDYDPNAEGGALGTGFFAGGSAQAESDAERTLTIDGQRANLGRALPTTRAVGSLFGHDSTAYDVTAGVSQFAADVLLDPLALASGGSATAGRVAARLGASARAVDVISGGISGARKAAKQLDAAEAASLLTRLAGGVESGGRRSAIIEDVQRFFGNRQLLDKLAEDDAYTIYQSFKRSSANHVDTSLIARLGKASDEAAVSSVLLDAVQRGRVTEKGFYSGLSGARRGVRNTRLAGASPRGKISVDDLDDATDKIDSFLRQAKVDRATRAKVFDDLIEINDPSTPWASRNDRFYDVVTDAMGHASDNLAGDLESIKKATRLTMTDAKAARAYGVETAGNPILTPFIRKTVDPGTGVETLIPTPQLTSELLEEGFHLPEVTAVRRAAKRATRAEKLYTSRGWEMGADAARWVTRDLFKPLAILRPAYVLRIGMEEQARLAAAGFDSLFNHPFRFIQANILARSADESLTGDSFEAIADGLNAVNRRAYNVTSDGRKTENAASIWTQIRKGETPDRDFMAAWRRELGQLSAAREARQLAKDGNLANFLRWARETEEGRGQIERIARINDEAGDLLTDDDALLEWGESIKQRLAAKAGGEVVDGVTRSLGDDKILDAIAQGRFAVADASQTSSASLTNMLRGKFDRAPGVLKVEASVLEGDQSGRMSRAVDWLFDNITGKPTNKLARYPAFRQSYLRNAQRSMDSLADDGLRSQYAERMGEMFDLTKQESEELARSLSRHAGKEGFVDDISELDELIKVRSATEVKDLLFDVTKRSNIQDAHEVALPFFDAWKEVTTTWARLVKENPAAFIRAGQGLQSAREQGVVYSNDFGEEVFAYPGSGILSSFFPGEDTVTLEGRLQGANLVAQGVGPGFGPIVQWGTGAFLPKDDEFQELREWLAPFGTGGIESAGDLSNPGAILGAITPAWARKVTNAWTGGDIDPVQLNSMAGDVAKILANSGAYDPSNPTDQQRLIADAGKGARWMLFIRGLAQGVSITGPSAVWRVKTDGEGGEAIPEGWDPEADPDGQFHTVGVLGNEYRRLLDHYNHDDQLATAAFADMYGLEPYYIAQAKTRSLANLPVDEEGFGWVRDHVEAAGEYPSTIGYFVPPDEEAELDYAIYRDQIEAGDRQSLTAEQQVQLANKAKAYSILTTVRKRIEEMPSAVREKALSQTRAILEEEYPGYSAPVLGVGDRLDTDERINELSRAAFDERLSDSPVAQTLQTYMQAREALLTVAQQERGVQTLQAQASADLALRLQEIGLYLSSRNPAFSGVWSRLLAREVTEE